MTEKKNPKSDIEQALKNPRIKNQYMKEMERVFQGPKGSPQHDKDLQRLHDAYGSARFSIRAREYIKKYGLPDDWGALLLLLDLKNANELIPEVMEKLVKLSKEKSGVKKRGLRSKLRTISVTARDLVIADTAARLVEEI